MVSQQGHVRKISSAPLSFLRGHISLPVSREGRDGLFDDKHLAERNVRDACQDAGVQGAGHLSSGGKSLLICPLIGGEKERLDQSRGALHAGPIASVWGHFSQGHARLAVTPGPRTPASNSRVGPVNLAKAFPVQCVRDHRLHKI